MPLRVEVSKFESSTKVVPGSVRVLRKAEDGRDQAYLILATVKRAARGFGTRVPIAETEPLAFVYSLRHTSMGYACPDIYSERKDFPTNLPHLNPVSQGTPSHLCIAREGSKSLYLRVGILGLLERTSRWLLKAAYKESDAEGWEPVLVNTDHYAQMSVGYYQRLAEIQSGGGSILGATLELILSSSEHGFYRIEQDIPFSIDNLQSVLADERFSNLTPWAFVWPEVTRIARSYRHPRIDSVDDLLAWANDGGLLHTVTEVINAQLGTLQYSSSFAILVMGHWRPKPLRPAIPDLAEGKGASLELTAFRLDFERKANGTWNHQSITGVQPLRILSKSTPKLMRAMAGIKKRQLRTAIVGCGALGSHIAEHLVREGAFEMLLVDYDDFMPHNVARHVLTTGACGENKADFLSKRLSSLTNATVSAQPKSLQTLLEENDPSLNHVECIVDTSAEPNVARYLSSINDQRPLLKAFLADEGRLGVLLIDQKKPSQTASDMMAWLMGLADQLPAIAHWLNDDEALQSVSVGLSCASETMRMSDTTVACHAAVIARRIRDYLTRKNRTPGILVNELSLDGLPVGAQWFDCPDVHSLKAPVVDHEKDVWDVRMPDSEAAKIAHWVEASDDEQGGYLYGTYDTTYKVINVGRAVHLADAEGSPAGLKLPPAGSTPEERLLLAKTAGKLPLVGTWHTHPDGHAKMSPKDLAEARRVSNVNNMSPRPYALTIGAPGELSANVVYPESWLIGGEGE